MKQKTCIFCNQTISGQKSKEHIIPQWALDYFKIRNTKITPTHFSSGGSVIKSVRKHTLNNLVSGKICQQCNNGWMSKLEYSVKENIINLAENKKTVVELNPKERFLLARWTFKTALALNCGSNFLKNIPQDHYSYIFKNADSLPKHVVVFAQQHRPTEKFYWIQGSQWQIEGKDFSIDKKLKATIETKSYKIALQLGYLILLVAYNPVDNYLFLCWKGIHVPLHPLKGKVMYFERDDFPWNNSIDAITIFHFSLGLFDPYAMINYKR